MYFSIILHGAVEIGLILGLLWWICNENAVCLDRLIKWTANQMTFGGIEDIFVSSIGYIFVLDAHHTHYIAHEDFFSKLAIFVRRNNAVLY